MAQRADDVTPWVRVIVVNYNGGALLQPCLDALAAQTFKDFEAIVVDNASTDGSLDQLRLPDARFSLLRNASNGGFAAANNMAARGCRAPWLATLNPDTVAEPGWLEEMRKGTQRYATARVFGATLIDAEDPEVADGFGDVLSITGIPWRGGQGQPVAALPDHDIEVFAPCAAAALYDRQSFTNVGGFDETFFCYVEDVDLGFRLRLAGERCMQLRRAIVRHHGSAITGGMSDFTLFHSYRNRLWLIWKDMPAALLPFAIPLNLAWSALILLVHACRGAPVKAPLQGLLAGLFPAGTVWKSRRVVQQGRRVSTITVARWLVWRLRGLNQRPVTEIT